MTDKPSKEALDIAANKLINSRWVNKDGRTTGDSTIYGLSFNELHGMLVRFALAALEQAVQQERKAK